MAFIRQNIKLLFVFVLPVYIYVVQNTIQNKHTHVSASGMVVTHSHPFDQEGESAGNGHDHSKMEICLYCGFLSDFYEPARHDLVVEVFASKQVVFLVRNDQFHYNKAIRKGVTRGPPA